MPRRRDGPTAPLVPSDAPRAAFPLLRGVDMNALLTALLLSAAPAVPSPEAAAPLEASAPRRVVWVQPLGSAALGLGLLGNSAFYLPVGMNLPLGESTSTSLGLELTLTMGSIRASNHSPGDRAFPNYWRVQAAAGPQFSLSGRPFSGFFVHPKLITHYSYEPAYGFGDNEHAAGSSVELRLGVDVGWQFTVGDFYIAPVLGLSAGYGFNLPKAGDALEPSRVLPPEFVGYSPRRRDAPVLGLNLDLLRVGTVF